MSATGLSLLQSATHIAFDPFTPERLLEIGAKKVIRSLDCLVLGPSRGDPTEHASARRAWWNSSEEWDQLNSWDARLELPVIAWVSASLLEKLSFWRSCKWLRHLGIAAKDVRVLTFDEAPRRATPPEGQPSWNCTASVTDHRNEVLLDRLAKARPFSRSRYDQAVSLWDRYTDESPLRFVQSCLDGVPGFPELEPLWAFLSNLFPRRAQDGTLRLNCFDELLLHILSSEHQTPVKVFVHDSPMGIELRQLASCAGDLFVARRLEQWASHASSGAVERAPGPKPGTPMLAFTYPITESGRRLQESGLTNLTDAPSLAVAGTEAYAQSAPWVLLEDGRLSRL